MYAIRSYYETRIEVPIPADLVEPAREARLAIAEALSDFSEEIMEMFLEDKA